MITKNLKKELEVRVRLAGYIIAEDGMNFSEVCKFGGCQKKGTKFYYFQIGNSMRCILANSCEKHQKLHEGMGWHEL